MNAWKLAIPLCLSLIGASALEAQTKAGEPPENASPFQTPVTVELLDPATLTENTEGIDRSIKTQKGTLLAPRQVILTRTTKPDFVGLTFGDTKTPGNRYLRIGFVEPITVGTVITLGNVSVSVLKEKAPYPGNLADDTQWIPAQRVDSGAITDAGPGNMKRDACETWLLPQGTKTRALRFTHSTGALDQSYAGLLRGVSVLAGRFANLAPQAVAMGSVSKYVELINNEAHDSWTAWDNDKGNRPKTVAEDPEWLMLVWPKPVTLRGMALLWAGFSTADVDVYTGPENVHPRDASAADWRPVAQMTDIKNFYPTTMALNWQDFGKEVTTRALRMRITAATVLNGREKNGRRVWLGEWLALGPLGDKPIETALIPKTSGNDEAAQAIPIHFSMPEKGYVTLVIDDAKGNRVRNLISETPYEAGEHSVRWDGTDDLARDPDAAGRGIYQIPVHLVSPGDYHVRGLWRKEIVPSYEFSVYNPGNPPWGISDHTGGWLANHSPPEAAVFVPAKSSPTGAPVVFLGCYVTEGADDVAWVDLDGHKKGGKGWIGGNWTGASFMAFDAGSKADPSAWVYTGAGWKSESIKDSSLLRLNALTAGGDKSVMDLDLGVLPTGATMSSALTGLAVRDGILVASLGLRNELVFIDVAARKESHRMIMDHPRGVAFDSTGRLLVLSGKKLLRFPQIPFDGGKPETVVETDLEDPQNLVLDVEGNIYISDWGNSHQVKVFSPQGKFLHAIGHAGLPKAGPYDAQHMNHPAGIAIDSRNQLWVAEKDDLPRRISVWSLDGNFIRAFYGPAKYGGGGTLDPKDKTRFYYAQEHNGAMEFRLDWDKGTSVLDSVYYRKEEGGFELNMGGSAPETALYYDGRRYFTNCYNDLPTSGAYTAVLFEERGDRVARPVAAMGAVILQDVLKSDAYRSRWPAGLDLQSKRCPSVIFFWSDTNGDGRMQPEEVVMRQGLLWGITVMPDLSFCAAQYGETSTDGPADGNAVRFPPVKFDQNGVPSYDPDQNQVLVKNTHSPAGDGGNQVLTDKDGWTVVSLGFGSFARESLSGTRGGSNNWSYPTLWPGLHAGHHAPEPDRLGEVIASTRLLGGFMTCGDETLWAINTDKGSPCLFTRDGLFVATLFKDNRVGQDWKMPVAQRGMSLEGLSLGGENFWPTMTTVDGKFYLVDGRRCALVRLEGLDTIRRLPETPIKVTPEDLLRAAEHLERQEALRQSEKGHGTLKVSLLPSAPVVDGALDDWKDSQWVEIDRRGGEHLPGGASIPDNAKDAAYNIRGAVAIAEGRLYAAWKTVDPKLLSNSGEMPIAPFKTGGALDLMIGANPKADPKRNSAVDGDSRLLVTQVAGKTKAMLYRAVVSGTKNADKVPFSSPWRTITFDRVEDVSDKVQLATDRAGNFEISVPLEVLGLDPRPGLTIKGDIGILRGNGTETLSRTYWTNKAAAIVSDVPSEAELAPGLWGVWEFDKP